MAEHLARVPERIGSLYRAYEAMARSCGDDVEVVPQRSRIVFMVRVRYAGAVLQQRAVDARFALRREETSPRVWKRERFDDLWVGHHVKLRDEADLDAELAGWLCESYRLGRQES